MAEVNFYRRKIIEDKLIPFGFSKTDYGYEYKTLIADKQMEAAITVDNGSLQSTVTDLASGEEFVLHLVSSAGGSFVGKVREDYEKLLSDIKANCTEPDVFKSDQAKELIEYVRNTYNDELEYLWDKFPDNAVWRRKDSGKWYGAVLTAAKEKLGLDNNEKAEIIDLRIDKQLTESTVDGVKYFPGYHMNKKSWYTIILDGSVPTEEICRRLQISYDLAK